MANTRSARKSCRQAQRRAVVNRSRRSDVRTHLKKAHEAVQAALAGSVDLAQAREAVRVAESKMFKRASLGMVVSRKAASRRISRLVRRLKGADADYQSWLSSAADGAAV